MDESFSNMHEKYRVNLDFVLTLRVFLIVPNSVFVWSVNASSHLV